MNYVLLESIVELMDKMSFTEPRSVFVCQKNSYFLVYKPVGNKI